MSDDTVDARMRKAHDQESASLENHPGPRDPRIWAASGPRMPVEAKPCAASTGTLLIPRSFCNTISSTVSLSDRHSVRSKSSQHHLGPLHSRPQTTLALLAPLALKKQSHAHPVSLRKIIASLLEPSSFKRSSASATFRRAGRITS